MKKMFKTLISSLLLLSIMFSFAACNSSADEVEPQIIELTEENIVQYLFINDSVSGLNIPDGYLGEVSWIWHLKASPQAALIGEKYEFIDVEIRAKVEGFGTKESFIIDNIDEEGYGEVTENKFVRKSSYEDSSSQITITSVSGTLKLYE